MIQIVKRARGWLIRRLIQHKIAGLRKMVHAENVTIISQNCIGGVFYHDMRLPFLSPTINTFIPEPGFVKMVLNLHHYMEQELVIRWGEEYPIGMLGDVEIHFMHYNTCQEAKEAWDRRKQRINWDKIFVIATDRDGFNDAVYELWKKIPYPKLLFTANSEYTDDAVLYRKYASEGEVADLISGRMIYQNAALIQKISNL